jgi:hypothetical protein
MHQFDRDIQLHTDTDRLFSGIIADNWSINDVPDGGYLMAILTRAMMLVSDMHSTPIITANYLKRCEPGRVRVSVEKLATSRQFNRLQATMHQKGEKTIRAFGTFAGENNECVLESYDKPTAIFARLEDCLPVPELPTYSLFGRMDIRLDPFSTGWLSGNLSDRSEMRGYIKFKDDRPFDVFGILLAADSFPPAVLASQGMVAWVPTLEFSVNIRNMPQTAWLKCVFRTRFITCGLLEEDGEIWDANDQLIAISRQIAQYRTAT